MIKPGERGQAGETLGTFDVPRHNPAALFTSLRDDMTAAEFRCLALEMPRATESAHMDHPDFRVGKKVFATLGYPTKDWAMVKLTPEQQESVLSEAPGLFSPANGAWGRRGATLLRLAPADMASARRVIGMAWANAEA